MLGGSSSLNGLIYVRGQAEDYDHWAALGNRGWSYAEVLPYFRKSEDQQRGADAYHGIGGPQKVSDLRLRRSIAEKFIEAARSIGIPANDDCNGERQEGVGYFQQTAYKGFRWSTAKSFLRPVRHRSNLKIQTGAQVTRILFDGNRATGIEYRFESETRHAHVNAEIIVCAGSINSPQILQCSGIGDASHLMALGIPVVHELPGVGKNLQDHLQIRLIYKTYDHTLNDELNHFLKRWLVGAQYILTRTGPLTLAASQVAIFTRSKVGVERPDIQFHMQPLSADKPGEGVHKFSAFTSSVCQLRPWSRGEVNIVSPDPLVYPAIVPNYLSDERDCEVAVSGIKVARRIASVSPLKESIIEEFVPGSKFANDDELLQAARQFSQTIYHPTSTCKMGHDPMAVVDDRLRVHGLVGLRIADASIMPEITSGNTNAPTIMIGEKVSDMIIEDYR